MLSKYKVHSLDEERNAFKEIVQEIALCGLSRAGFFKEAAFYGGTALRIFYGLDRFSEDLDFSLMSTNHDFDLTKYFPALESQMNSVGLNFKVEEKVKSVDSNIKSAFLKGNTKEHILSVYRDNGQLKNLNPHEVIKIKFEVDTNPPAYANFENKFRLLPSPYPVKLYDLPSLFAGKIHAVICRGWKNRVKGRDLYDYVFYLTSNAPVNLKHLTARLKQSNYIDDSTTITIDDVKRMLVERFEKIDYEQAKQDVWSFVSDKSKFDFWSAEFFIDITNSLRAE
jgi:predicted nucleotidyltransferase component of viral defense system